MARGPFGKDAEMPISVALPQERAGIGDALRAAFGDAEMPVDARLRMLLAKLG